MKKWHEVDEATYLKAKQEGFEVRAVTLVTGKVAFMVKK